MLSPGTRSGPAAALRLPEEDAKGAAALTVRKEGHPVRPLLARGGARRVPITVSATVKAAQTEWPPLFHSEGSVHHFDMSELKLNAVFGKKCAFFEANPFRKIANKTS